MGKLSEAFPNICIVHDTDWIMNETTSRPMRGLVDSDRFITFSIIPTEEDLAKLKLWLEKEAMHRQVGWTGVGFYRMEGSNTYKFRTTWDSSG